VDTLAKADERVATFITSSGPHGSI
jgi:hypothetical protein